MKDYFAVLGLTSAASASEVRRAYRDLARKLHPDINPDPKAIEAFKEISEAYQTLSDPDKRRSYERRRNTATTGSTTPNSPTGSYTGGATFSNAKSASAHYRATDVNATGGHHKQRSSNGRTNNSSHRYASAYKHTTFDYDEAELAAESRNRVSRQPLLAVVKNGVSAASAAIANIIKLAKELRRNEGFTSLLSRTQGGNSSVSIHEVQVTVIEAILGVEKILELPGAETQRKLRIQVPPGVRSGTVLHLHNRDATSAGNDNAVVVVKVRSHPFLSLHTRGIVCEIPITIVEAISGGRIQVPTFDEPAIITIPPYTQSGQEFRLKGKGIVKKGGDRGDLFIRVLVKIPTTTLALPMEQALESLSGSYGNIRQELPERLPG